jgi:hypothetical protein
LTAEDAAAAAKKVKTKSSTAIAVVMDTVSDSDDSEDSDRSVSDIDPFSPFSIPHLYWDCLIDGPSYTSSVQSFGLIDDGAHLALIDKKFASDIGLRQFCLHKPVPISFALSDTEDETSLTHYVKLCCTSRDQSWTSSSVRFLVADNLCAPLLFGLLWLAKNHVVIDHEGRTVIDKCCGFDLFNPPEFKPPLPPKLKLREKIKKNVADRKTMVKELDTVCKLRKDALELKGLFKNVKQVDVIAAVRERVEVLAHWAELDDKGSKLKAEFKCLFEPMPHVDELPTDILCQIKLKDTEKTFQSRSYQSPRK